MEVHNYLNENKTRIIGKIRKVQQYIWKWI